MGKFDQSIDWLQAQIGNAKQAVADLVRGDRITIDDKDETENIKSMHERLIERYNRLIEAYRAKND